MERSISALFVQPSDALFVEPGGMHYLHYLRANQMMMVHRAALPGFFLTEVPALNKSLPSLQYHDLFSTVDKIVLNLCIFEVMFMHFPWA